MHTDNAQHRAEAIAFQRLMAAYRALNGDYRTIAPGTGKHRKA